MIIDDDVDKSNEKDKASRFYAELNIERFMLCFLFD